MQMCFPYFATSQIPGSEVVRSAGVCYRCYQDPDRSSKHLNVASVGDESPAFSLLESQLLTSVIRASVVSAAPLRFNTTATAETSGCKRKHPVRSLLTHALFRGLLFASGYNVTWNV